MTDYRKALETLRDGGVRFIVIGGVAATAHGSTQRRPHTAPLS
jgi:hypothetical protein